MELVNIPQSDQTAAVFAAEGSQTTPLTLLCLVCGETFSSSCDLQEHVHNHKKQKPFQCSFCDMRYKEFHEFRKHLAALHTTRPFRLKVGEIAYSNNGENGNESFSASLQINCPIDKFGNKYRCTFCSETLLEQEQFLTHIRLHMGKTYKCSQCEKRFHREDLRNRHFKRVHTGFVGGEVVNKVENKSKSSAGDGEIDPILDTVAVEVTSDGSVLIIENNNSGCQEILAKASWMTQCTFCNKRFHSKHNYEEHLLTHTKVKPYTCVLCGAKFRQQSAVTRHIKKIHKDYQGGKAFRKEIDSNRVPNVGKSGSSEDVLKVNEITQKRIGYTSVDDTRLLANPGNRSVTVSVNTNVGFIDNNVGSVAGSGGYVNNVVRSLVGTGGFIDSSAMSVGRSEGVIDNGAAFVSHGGTSEVVSMSECTFCSEKFLNDSLLREHMLKHSSENLHACASCGMIFAQHDLLDKHVQTEHKELNSAKTVAGPSDAGRAKSIKESFTVTKGVYLKKDVITRDVQNLTMAVTGIFDKESNDKSSKKLYQCNICGRVCTTGLQEHMRIHTGEKPHRCELCGKQFRLNTYKKEHIKRFHKGHSNLSSNSSSNNNNAAIDSNDSSRNVSVSGTTGKRKRFQCTFCSKMFFNKADVIKHTRQHTGEKPFRCEMCKTDFVLYSSLKRHMRNIHAGCPVHKVVQTSMDQRGDKRAGANWNVLVVEASVDNQTGSESENGPSVETGDNISNDAELTLGTAGGSKCTCRMKKKKSDESSEISSLCNNVFKQAQRLQDHMRLYTAKEEKPLKSDLRGKFPLQSKSYWKRRRIMRAAGPGNRKALVPRRSILQLEKKSKQVEIERNTENSTSSVIEDPDKELLDSNPSSNLKRDGVEDIEKVAVDDESGGMRMSFDISQKTEGGEEEDEGDYEDADSLEKDDSESVDSTIDNDDDPPNSGEKWPTKTLGMYQSQNFYKVFRCNFCNRVFPHKSILHTHLFEEHKECTAMDVLTPSSLSDNQADVFWTEHIIVIPRSSSSVGGSDAEVPQTLKEHPVPSYRKLPKLYASAKENVPRKLLPSGQPPAQIKTESNNSLTARKNAGTRSTDGEKLKKGAYQCTICSKRFSRELVLQEHLRSHSGERPHKCDLCGKTFNYLRNIKRHMLYVHNMSSSSFREEHSEDDEDSVDDAKTDKGDGDDALMKSENGVKPKGSSEQYHCKICGKTFPKEHKFREQRFQEHVRSHTGERPYQCDFCGKAFNYYRNVKRHMIKVHAFFYAERKAAKKNKGKNLNTIGNEKDISDDCENYDCTVCGKSFQTRASLNGHMKCHKNTGPYKCYLCEEVFSSVALRRSHVTECHKGQTVPKGKKTPSMALCSICGKLCVPAYTLKYHMLKHSDKKPYECGVCQVKFKSDYSLRHHMKFRHRDESSKAKLAELKCAVCNKTFPGTQKNHFEEHLRSHSDEMPFKCDFCHSKFKYESSIKSHLKFRSLRGECPKKSDVTGEKRFECTVCGVGLSNKPSLKRHMLIHSGRKPYRCDFCGVMFRWRSTCKKHVKTVHAGQIQTPVVQFESSTENEPAVVIAPDIDHHDNNDNAHLANKEHGFQAYQIVESVDYGRLAERSEIWTTESNGAVYLDISKGTPVQLPNTTTASSPVVSHQIHGGSGLALREEGSSVYLPINQEKVMNLTREVDNPSFSFPVNTAHATSIAISGQNSSFSMPVNTTNVTSITLSNENSSYYVPVPQDNIATNSAFYLPTNQGGIANLAPKEFSHSVYLPVNQNNTTNLTSKGEVSHSVYLPVNQNIAVNPTAKGVSHSAYLPVNQNNLTNPTLNGEFTHSVYLPVNQTNTANLNSQGEISQSVYLPVQGVATSPTLKEQASQSVYNLPVNQGSAAVNIGAEGEDDDKERRESCKKVPCTFCGKTFLRSNLPEHMLRHTGEKPHQCHLCESRYRQRSALLRHWKKAHNIIRQPDILFGDKNAGQKPHHEEIVRRRKGNSNKDVGRISHIYQCAFCDAQFRVKQVFQRHMRSHAIEVPYECDFCHARFKHLPGIRKHLRMKELTGACPVYRNTLVSGNAGNFTKTINSAEGEPAVESVTSLATTTKQKKARFQCPICSEAFSVQRIFHEHVRTHTGERPHKCDVCEKTFNYYRNVKRHMRNVHTSVN